jgi:hypothetical protein
VSRSRLLAGAGAGVALLLAAAPAVAAAGSSVTVESGGQSVAGQTLTAEATVDVQGDGANLGQVYKLVVQAPNGTSQSDSQRATLRGHASPAVSVHTTDWNGSEAPNGPWTATLTGGGQASFTLAVPPSQVDGFTASGGKNRVALHWKANREPDLVAYVITLPDGSTETESSSDAGCSVDTHCAINYQPSAHQAGRTLTFHIAAERNGACGCASSPVTGPAVAAQVDLPAASSPSPSPTTTGGKKSGGNGSGGQGGVVTRGGSFPSGGSAGSDGVGHNGYTSGGKLQAFVPDAHVNLPRRNLTAPSGSPPTAVLPGGEGARAAQSAGGYRPTLAYPPGRGRPGATVASQRSVTASFLNVIDQSALWRSLGLAAILLLGGTHLLVWLRHPPTEM